MQRQMTADSYTDRGNDHKAQGKLQEAISDYTQAIALDPKFAAAYINRGKAYNDQRRRQEAIADYTQAIALDPKCAAAYINRGCALYAQGKLQEAISDYTQTIALNSEIAFAYHNRGKAHQVQRNLQEAISDYTQAIALDPKCAHAYKHLDTEGKDVIFSAIKLFPIENQIPLLQQCIDPSTALGKRFWKQEGLTACSVEKGTLKEICDYLKKIDLSFKMLSQSVKQSSILSDDTTLFGYRSQQPKMPEINPVFEHDIFKL